MSQHKVPPSTPLVIRATETVGVSKTGHQAVGLAVGVWVMAFLGGLHAVLTLRIVAGVMAFFGATAPDWLELSWAVKNHSGEWDRRSIIPHRTITHWLPLWLIPEGLVVVGLCGCLPEIAVTSSWPAAAVLGFLSGGLSHLACDVPNPTGIPVWWPTRQYRFSLHGWRSGSPWEWILVAGFWGIAWWVWPVAISGAG